MMSVTEVMRWLKTLDPEGCVAIDEGGLQLVEIDRDGKPTEAYMEVGGIPDDD